MTASKKGYPFSIVSGIGYIVGGLMFASGLEYEFQKQFRQITELEKIHQTIKFVGGTGLIVLGGIAQVSKKEDFWVPPG